MTRMPGIAAAVVAAVAVSFVPPRASAQFNIFGLGGPKTPASLARELDQPVPPKLVATLAGASRAGLDFTAAPAAAGLKAIRGPRIGAGGKAGLLYVGADFCPFCACERWGLMLTLLRFGKFSGLRYMLSTASDVYPNTPTVTFQHARYQSPYVDFQAVETATRAEHRLMTPDKLQAKILATFDMPPYVQIVEPIPFVYVDGHYMSGQLLVTPAGLAHRDWQQIADTLADPKSRLFRSVMPRVNLLTAALCQLDGDKPADVCGAPGVTVAKRVLATLHTQNS